MKELSKAIFAYFQDFAEAAKANDDVIADMQELTDMKNDRSGRVYDVVHREKIALEDHYQALLDAVDVDLGQRLKEDWPEFMGGQQILNLEQCFQSVERDDFPGLMQGAARVMPMVERLCEELLKAVPVPVATCSTSNADPSGSASAAPLSSNALSLARVSGAVRSSMGSLAPSTGSSEALAMRLPRTAPARVVRAPLKGVLRMLEKLALEPDATKRGDVRQLRDVARCSIVASSTQQLTAVVQELCKQHRNSHIRILRVKNRFADPTLGGWRDVLLNAVFLQDAGLHIFELQLLHEKLALVRLEMGAHDDYDDVRAAKDILATLDTEKITQAITERTTNPRSMYSSKSFHSLPRSGTLPEFGSLSTLSEGDAADTYEL